MSRIIIAALVAISTAAAEAADGCGRGWFYNGRRCVPQDEPGPRYLGPRPRYYEPEPPVAGPQLRLDLSRRDEPQYTHQIRALRRGTTVRRTTQFRMACVSHTEDASRSLPCCPATSYF